ncbi:hypothetical protein [Streptomyces sp. NBC_01614]|uniref:hypothetical protein n=1 Tax=Streptomyces sp. NBC_01614 TaxID=2975897 RepID=UPI0038637614
MIAVWWALWVLAAAALVWQIRRALRHESMQDQIVRETRERAEAAREVDDLELLYSMPAFDPAWDAGRERLWNAIRDEQTKGDHTP